MDELRFLSIIASPSQNVKQPGIADSNSTNLPPIISRFPPGSILAGFVINRDAAGNPILRTESGDITFQSNLFLKIGTELVIRIENRSGHPQAHILTINGEPPPAAEKVSVLPPPTEGTSPQQASKAAAELPAAATTQAARPSIPAATVNVQATITATLASNTPALPQGSQLVLKIISAEAPAPTPQLPQPPQAPQAQTTANPLYAAYAKAAGTQAAPPAIPTTPATTPATAPALPPLPGTPTPAATTITSPAAATPLASGQVVQANVISSTPAGETILQTSNGINFQLNTTTPLAQGIRLTFEIGQITQPGATAPQQTNAEEPAPLTALARNWASLQQIMTLLRTDTALQNMGITSLPLLVSGTQPQSGAGINPQAISSGLMVFIAALRGGDFRGWLGQDNARRLEDAGHGSLIRKAEGEFLSLGRQFHDTQPGQWQTLFFPLATHGEVQQVRFFLKRDKKQKNDREGRVEEDTRFIVELELSQMGELQLDGFVRKDPELLEFDLYIRSRTPLDEATRRDIFAIYNDMAELTSYKGQLAFQTVQEFPVRPMEETHPEHIKDVSA
jgi:hypothetical protein